MQNKTLQMKRALRTALLVLLLIVAGITNVFADGYDFAEVCPSGQTLYYKIDPNDSNGVILVPPYYYYFTGNAPPIFEAWGGYERPVGDLIIPETISNGMVVNGIGKFCTNDPHYAYPDPFIHIGAFAGCEEITSVTIPNSMTFIEDGAFGGCTSLTSITIGNSVTRIGSYYDSDDVSIMEYAGGSFAGCTNLTTIEFGNSLTFIGIGSFSGCSSLTSVTFPDCLTSIGQRAFSNCSNLTSISFPNSLRKIGIKAFENSGLYDAQNEGILYVGPYCIGYNGNKPTGNLVIAEGTRIIADEAFAVCEGIFSVGLPNSLVSIGIGTFFGCTSITSITLPNSLAFIGRSAFEECSGLTFVSIPKTVTEIEYFAFDWCSHLSNIYYNAVNAVCKGRVFKGCDNLATIIIGPDVQSINANVFKNCNSAHLVVALGSTPAVLESGAFSEIAEDAMLMVPCGKRITYFSQWNMFPYNNIIENCDQYTVSMSGVGPGGSITPSTTNAQMGEEVLLTVTPNAGMALESIAICNANDPTQTIPYYFPGKATSTIGFIMPQFGVTVKAVFKTSGASVEESNGIAATVYPNPTNGLIKIEAVGLKHISISNLFGQCIYEGNANGDEFNYDFSRYKAGIYLIRIGTASGIALKKVSVVR